MSVPPEMYPHAPDKRPLFGDRYWRQGEALTASRPPADPDHVDGDDYKLLADNLPTLCWMANPDGYITWYNRRWHEYCGTTAEEMEGWGWQSVHDPAVLPEVIDKWTASIASGQPFEMVFPLRGADGVFRPFLTRIIPVHDGEGRLRRWIGNNIDISQQASVEQELRRSRQELEEANRALAEREAFLSRVFASSTDCIKVLDLDGNLISMSEGGLKVMEVDDFGDIAGCPWPDFWDGARNEAAKAAIVAARAGETRSFIGQADTLKGTRKWWHVVVSPITGVDGQPDRILTVSRDITELRQSEAERDRFVRLAENSRDFVAMADLDGRAFYINDAGRELVGLGDADILQQSVVDFFPPEEASRIAEEIFPAVDQDGYWSGETQFRHFATGELIPVFYSVFPITDADGEPIGYGTVTRDIREMKRVDEDLHYLNGELAHRLKNVLAVVQSVAQQTLRNASDTQVAGQKLGARLVALGAATDVLTGGSWRSADLHELARRALAPHGEVGESIRIEGPKITVRPQVALALSLAFHELATNAAKYGALSRDGGTVRLHWHVEFDGEEDRFELVWRESGGPPVETPERKGFGSALIERSLSAYFRGQAETDYRRDGLVFTLRSAAPAALSDYGN
ncbi:PAS domain-containing protein [Qipengyuania spongiae]|uniref:histidine kinase n=1 Tax=Qipengyuania spongiae TaxID=2909673 RepID=A0ABY5T4W6_9SPHN|nr:PAS domain-containing protein [Qipengyuania spongiae]UVI40383.1 PAS domain-containing protein [Qipengyuania spongiae]